MTRARGNDTYGRIQSHVEHSTAALVTFVSASVWFDLRMRRIPNVLVVLGLALALVLGALEAGWAGAAARSLGALLGLALLLPLFLLRVVGAGDAKLMAAVGAFVGTSALWAVLLYTLIAGGVLGLVSLARARPDGTAVAAALRTRGATFSSHGAGLRGIARVPYAVAIAAGVAGWMLTRS